MKNLFLIILIVFVPLSALSFDSKTIINNISNSVSTGGNTSQGSKITTGNESEYVEVYTEEYEQDLDDQFEDEEGYWVEIETLIDKEESGDSKDVKESFEEEDEEMVEEIKDLEVLSNREDGDEIKEEKNFFRKIIDYVLFIFTF